MKKRLKKKKQLTKKTKIRKTGMAPGQMVFTGEQKVEKTRIQVLEYDKQSIEEHNFEEIHKALQFISKTSKTCWLNIIGVHEVEVVKEIVEHFDFHKLSGEDILSVGQRPKLDDYGHYIHLVARLFHIEGDHVEDEQISILFGEGILVTFQEKEGNAFDPILERMMLGKGLIRSKKTDYLAYALLDFIVDYYFIIIEHFGDIVEELEIQILEDPSDEVLPLLHEKRRDASYLRRSVFPLREAVSRFEKLDKAYVGKETKIFIRDLYDHTIQVIETVTVFKDSVGGLLDLYMSSVSNRMNNVMKVLTIVSTIFIPLTFIVGVYGMNFINMPELETQGGYYVTLAVMALISFLMIIYFKRKKWL